MLALMVLFLFLFFFFFLVFHDAVINKVHQARHALSRLFGKLIPKSRTNCVAKLGRTPVEGMRSQLPQ